MGENHRQVRKNYHKRVWWSSVFDRWGWGAPLGRLVHAHPRETPFSTQRSRAGLHVSALQSCLHRRFFFSVSWTLRMFGRCRAKQQNLEERQADVEYELRCLLNKPGVCSLGLWTHRRHTHSAHTHLIFKKRIYSGFHFWFFLRERLDGGGQRSGAGAHGGAGYHHWTEEPNCKHHGPGPAEVSDDWGLLKSSAPRPLTP